MNKKAFVFLIIGFVLLLGIFYATKSGAPTVENAGPQITERIMELEVENGKVVKGESVLKGYEGERITIRVTSNKADELHLHGYDLAADLSAGVQGEISFMADMTGRFAIELHSAHAEIAAIEIFPE